MKEAHCMGEPQCGHKQPLVQGRYLPLAMVYWVS